MNKKRILMITVIVVVLAGIVTAAILYLNREPQEPDVKEPIPGIEDSIFDDDVPKTIVTPEPPKEQNESNTTEESDQPSESQENASQPSQEQEAQPDTPPEPGALSYEDYNDMNGAQQRAYMESFENIEDFFDWYFEAKEAYDEAHPDIDVGDAVIDLDELMGNG